MIITREEFIKWLRTWAKSFDFYDDAYGNTHKITVTLDVPEILELPNE